jgi:hypothetical protein
MNWRWAVPALVGLTLIDTLMGFAAYTTTTWTGSREVTHWAAVRIVCLEWFPITIGCLALAGGLLVALCTWAMRVDE